MTDGVASVLVVDLDWEEDVWPLDLASWPSREPRPRLRLRRIPKPVWWRCCLSRSCWNSDKYGEKHMVIIPVWRKADLTSVMYPVGGLPLPKVLKNMSNHMFSALLWIVTGSFGFGMKNFSYGGMKGDKEWAMKLKAKDLRPNILMKAYEMKIWSKDDKNKHRSYR